MSYPSQLDGTHLYQWVSRAVAALSARRAEINGLNVFPVPDADTGSNMTHTMESALAAVEELDDASRSSVVEVTQALARGGVRGARGNSGVVLSQVLRALAEAAVDKPVGKELLASTLEIAVSLVDRAISDPVEGTVVTVLRAAAAAAREAVDAGHNLHDVLSATVAAARTALANTPSQLPALREAGVVDAGGAGLVVLLQSLLAEVEGAGAQKSLPTVFDEPGPAESGSAESGPAEAALTPQAHGTPGELEVMFYFEGDLDALEERLREPGNSLVIARVTDREGTVHVHSDKAGLLIEESFAMGTVRDLRLEILPQGPVVEAPRRIIVALTPPGEVAALYRATGATVVEIDTEREDPDDNIVTRLLATIRASRAKEVILLPNGLLSRRQLSSVDKAVRAFAQEIALLPTQRVVSGLAALSVHEENEPLATATYTMSEAASAMRTAVVVQAERAGLTTAGACAKGDFLAEAHGQVVAVAEEVDVAVGKAAAYLLDAGGEQVSVVTDADVDAEALEKRLGVDVLAYPGSGLGVAAEIGVE